MKEYESLEKVPGKLNSYLTSKPVWLSWIVYTVFTGILFLAVYSAVSLMALQWWIPIVAIIAAGITWGTLRYRRTGFGGKTL